MFAAVALFVILLLGLLYIAFNRFSNPPPPSDAPPVVAAPASRGPGQTAAAAAGLVIAMGDAGVGGASGGAGG